VHGNGGGNTVISNGSMDLIFADPNRDTLPTSPGALVPV
jgi:hypothetical protein